jgi:hypothetical protein
MIVKCVVNFAYFRTARFELACLDFERNVTKHEASMYGTMAI